MSGEGGGFIDSLCLWMNDFINFVLTNILMFAITWPWTTTRWWFIESHTQMWKGWGWPQAKSLLRFLLQSFLL